MADVRAVADAYGVRVEIVDLGDWGRVRLIAEYDPDGPVVRVNRREVSLAAADLAIAHELYHHREAIGEVRRLANRAAREAAADEYAETLLSALGGTAHIAAPRMATEAR